MLFHELSEEDRKKVVNAIPVASFKPPSKCPCTSESFNWTGTRQSNEKEHQYFHKCLKCNRIGQLCDTPEEAYNAWETEVLLTSS